MGWLDRWLRGGAAPVPAVAPVDHAEHRADFNAPVGTVNAPTTQHIYVMANGAGGIRPQPGSLLSAALLIDRGSQEAAIRDHLARRRTADGRWPPLLVVLPGREHGSHRTFVTRFGLHDMQRLLQDDGADDACHSLQCLRWPQGDTLADVLHILRQTLGLPAAFDGPDRLEAWLGRELPGSLCLAHRVTSAWWGKREVLTRAWVDFVLNAWPHPPGRQLIVVFLLIELPANTADALSAFVAELRRRAEDEPRLLVAPELDLVTKDDVWDWVDELGRRCQTDNPDLVARAQPLPDHLFPNPDVPRTFMEVYNGVLAFLNDGGAVPATAVATPATGP